MGRKSKFGQMVRLKIVQEYLKGNGSALALAKKYGCSDCSVYTWVAQYRARGEGSFTESHRNQSYSKEFKHMVVEEYGAGRITKLALANKYNIRSATQIRYWINLYNGHNEIKSYRTGGRIDMTKGRRTTYEERIDIVEDCLSNGQDYLATAEKHEVSYQQIYSWVQKYNTKGIVALKDKRGRGKDLEDMDEVERLEAENKLLKAKLKRLEIEVELKKKLQEVQMRLESTIRKKK